MKESKLPIPLTPVLVRALVAPEYPSQPLGGEEPLSRFLYQPMVEGGPPDQMLRFIDEVGGIVDHDDLESQQNEEKILRLLLYIADMPGDIPEDWRLEVWKYVLDQDWIHKLGRDLDLINVITVLFGDNPDYAANIRNVMRQITEEKIARLISELGTENAAEVNSDEFDMLAAMERYDIIRENHPDSLDLYNSIVILRMGIESLSYPSF